MRGSDEWLVIGFKAQRKKKAKKKENEKKKSQKKKKNVGLGSKWGKMRVWEVWMM